MTIEINSPRSHAEKEEYGDEETGWRSGSVNLLFFQRHGTHVTHSSSFNSDGGVREIASSVIGLLCKSKDMSSIPRPLVKTKDKYGSTGL